MKKLLVLLISISLTSIIFAQKENNIWYFEGTLGVDFNTTPPTSLSNSAMSTYLYPSTSVCDSKGNLLFYTNGKTVWNKNHQVMKNGVFFTNLGHSTNTVLVIKKPNSNSIYYLFNGVDDHHAYDTKLSHKVYYSEIDMSLNNGMGAVTSVKNILLTDSAGAGLTAVKKNCSEFWIITSHSISGKYKSFLVNSSGVSHTPVMSNVGSKVLGMVFLESSHDGNRIASFVYKKTSQLLYYPCILFDFDKNTGLLSNPLKINNLVYRITGIEFSPSGDFLYIGGGVNELFRFNLKAGSASALNNSRTNIFPSSLPKTYHTGDLRMGHDNKIYVNFRSFLGTITNPNSTTPISTHKLFRLKALFPLDSVLHFIIMKVLILHLNIYVLEIPLIFS